VIAILCDFLPIFGENNRIASKTNVKIKFLLKLAAVFAKNANFSAEFFGNFFHKIITSVSDLPGATNFG
jgi:hypothetical protein